MSNSTPVGPLVILGDALIGETLIARPNGIADADGINSSTQAFQWLRDGEPIFGATQQTYVVSSTDVGTQISIRYSYTDNGGTQEVITSKPEPTVPVTAPVSPTTPNTPVLDPILQALVHWNKALVTPCIPALHARARLPNIIAFDVLLLSLDGFCIQSVQPLTKPN